MAQLNVISWLWGDKYNPQDVRRLAKAVKKNLSVGHSFHLFSEYPNSFDSIIKVHPIEDKGLIDRNCFCRLRMFDPAWQKKHGLSGKIISLDLDLIITGNIDAIFEGESSFKILKGANSVNPNPFNASVMMLKCGEHSQVWSSFSVAAARKTSYHEFPDDQGWIWHMLPDADGWKVGKQSGIYAFHKPGWPKGSDSLPNDARIVSFIGRRKPQLYPGIPWIREYWNNA